MATITGSTNNDTLSGGSDDDLIYGLEGDDQLDGGGGTDVLEGGDGDNTYIFSGGNLTIDNVDSGGATEDYGIGDTLVLTSLTADQVTFARDSGSSNDLRISVNGSTDSIVVKYYFTGSLVSAEAIETVVFADSSTLTSAQINALTGAVNEAPVASDDSAATNMFTPLTVDVLANDYDPEGDSFSITGINSTTTLGDFTLNGDGTITFTPDGVSTGSADVSYTIADSAGNTAQATLTIAVSDGSNVAPVASDDSDSAHLAPVTVAVLGNDSDADGDSLSLSAISTTTTLGDFVVNGDNTVTFSPNGSATGAAVATYSVDDGNGHSVQAQLTINVTDSAPITSNDSADAHLTPVTVDVLANDFDVDGDSLSVSAVDSGTTLGDFVVNGDNTISFTPNGSATGDAVATYTVVDSFGSTSQAQLTVTVGNHAPALADDAASAYQRPVTVAVLANDSDLDGDTLSVTALDFSSALGDFVVNGDNTVTFTPNGSAAGDAVATYTVTDSFGGSSQAVLTVSVADSALSLVDDNAATDEHTPVTVDVLANDSNLNGDSLAVSGLNTGTTLGDFVVNGDNTVTFTPNGSAAGDAVATYTVLDGAGNSAQATLTVSVLSNDQALTGTAGADTLSGGSGDDSIDGLGGNDSLYGLGGNDTLKGGMAADKIYGGDGNDVLYASSPLSLLVNGSFETGDLSGWSAYQYTANASISVETGGVTPLTGLTVAAPTDGLYHAVFDEDNIAAHALVQSITAPVNASSLVLSFDLFGENQAGATSYNGSFDVTADDAEQFVRVDLLTSSANPWSLGAGVVVNLFQGLISNPTDQHFSFELQSYLTAGQSYQLRFSQASNQFFQTVALDNVRLLATVNDNAVDSLAGGAGDDLYVLDSASDKITELADQGADTVLANFSYQLGNHLEKLTLGGIANINGVGNSLDNVIEGNSGKNGLQGKAGNDSLAGGAGNDVLVGGTGDDVLDGGAGTDTVNYNTAAGGVQVDLTTGMAGGADDLDSLLSIENITGSAYDDTLNGNGVNNNLNGGLGNDTLAGDAGNDNLAGGAGNDALAGDAGNDYLTGGSGDDTLVGGAGADTANYNTASGAVQVDLTTGVAGGGDGDDSLSEIENIIGSNDDDILSGSDANNNLAGGQGNDTLTGNDGNDTLIGGTGSDVLSGGVGNDNLAGGAGDDLLDGGAGIDNVAYGLAGGAVQVDLSTGVASGADGADSLINIENIIGSSHDDTLTGDSASNTLLGAKGNDTLTGGAGNDYLAGGAGNDMYHVGLGAGMDRIYEADSTASNSDTLVFDGAVAYDQLWFRHVGNNLEVSIIGTTTKTTIGDWYSGAANHLEAFSAGGKTLTDAGVDGLVSAMAALTPPASGQTTLSSAYQDALGAVIAASWS